MRWPRRRKPDELGALLDAVTVPSPERAKPETPQVWEVFKTDALVRPEPETVPLPPLTLADLNLHDDYIRSLLADATETIPNPYAKETTMTSPFAGITLSSTIDELACAIHGTGYIAYISTEGTLPSGRPHTINLDTSEPKVAPPAESEVGSAAWLRDLADRIDTAREHVDAPNAARYLQSVVRRTADEVERDERQTAADTRDRERVEPILAARWAKDRDRQFLPSLVPTWDDLSDEERAHCIDYGLELYRAGREDTVAAWQPGNGGGSGNPGTRGGQPAGQGGAHHA